MPSLEVIRTLLQSSLAGKACVYIYIYLDTYAYDGHVYAVDILYTHTHTISAYLYIFIISLHRFPLYTYPYHSISMSISICSLDPFCSDFQSDEWAHFKAPGCRSMRFGLHEVVLMDLSPDFFALSQSLEVYRVITNHNLSQVPTYSHNYCQWAHGHKNCLCPDVVSEPRCVLLR